MAKNKSAKTAKPARPSRAKDPDELVHDPHGLDRVFVALRLREEFHRAIDRQRGGRSFSAAAHEAIEAGLKALGWS